MQPLPVGDVRQAVGGVGGWSGMGLGVGSTVINQGALEPYP